MLGYKLLDIRGVEIFVNLHYSQDEQAAGEKLDVNGRRACSLP